MKASPDGYKLKDKKDKKSEICVLYDPKNSDQLLVSPKKDINLLKKADHADSIDNFQLTVELIPGPNPNKTFGRRNFTYSPIKLPSKQFTLKERLKMSSENIRIEREKSFTDASSIETSS